MEKSSPPRKLYTGQYIFLDREAQSYYVDRHRKVEVHPLGRLREFDLDAAVDTAALLFWENGYDGMSLADLTRAIGITPPSLYFAFCSREGLFREVVDRYAAKQNSSLKTALRKKTAKEAALPAAGTFSG